MTWEQITKRRPSTFRRVRDDSVRVSTCSTGGQITLRISETLCRRARILIGDRACISVDPVEGRCMVSRTTAGGYSVRPMTNSTKKKGTYGHVLIQFTTGDDTQHKLFFPNGSKSYETTSAVVSDDGIVFDLAGY